MPDTSPDTSFIPHGARIAVLGQGYVGSCLTRALQACAASHNLTVTPLTRHDFRQVLPVQEFDYLINAAGYSGDFRANPIPTVESNISLTIEVLQQARLTTAYLAVSSTRVYGFTDNPTEAPATEDAPLPGLRADAIDTIYDGSKILLESLVLQGCKSLGLKPVVARLSNIYGAYGSVAALDDKTLIKKLIRLAREHEACTVNQNPLSSKDYIHADDAVAAMLRALFLSPPGGGIYNAASGTSNTLQQVADILQVPLHTPANAGNPTHRAISLEKARRELGFTPRHTLQTGLRAELQALTEERT